MRVAKADVRVIKCSNGSTVDLNLNDIDLFKQADRGTIIRFKNGDSAWVAVAFSDFMLQISDCNSNVECACNGRTCKEVKILYSQGFITTGNNLHVRKLNDTSYIEAVFYGTDGYRISLVESKSARLVVSVDVKCVYFTSTVIERIVDLFTRVEKLNTIERSLMVAGMSPNVDTFPVTWKAKHQGRYRCEVKQYSLDGTYLYVNGERQTKLRTARETEKVLHVFQVALVSLQYKLSELDFIEGPTQVGCGLTELSYSLRRNGKLITVNIFPCIDVAVIETKDYALESTLDGMTVNIQRLLSDIGMV